MAKKEAHEDQVIFFSGIAIVIFLIVQWMREIPKRAIDAIKRLLARQ